MAPQKIRVRFAPSPTGLLHVGNAWTAVYNWLFARHMGGDFLLRIEDCEVEPAATRFETQIFADLRWLGLNWDEGPKEPGGTPAKGSFGPYRQSERVPIYAERTDRLLDEGKAYFCFCTEDELDEERNQAAARRQPQIYSGRCRGLNQKIIKKNLAAGKAYAVRLKIEEEPLRFMDLVRGMVEFAPEAVSDPILVRSGQDRRLSMPVYNFVVALDDALMGITHVIRGDEDISSTPKQVAICKACGWPVPKFAHLSAILGVDRERLSKRHGAISISSFRERGYLPEAVLNYLALLGWGSEDGKTETFTPPELIKAFSLDRVTASSPIFDIEKLNWLNRHYFKIGAPSRLASLAWEYFGGLLPPKEDASDETLLWFVHLVAVFVRSVDHLDQLTAKALFIFGFDPELVRAREENRAALGADSARTVLSELAGRVRTHSAHVTPEVFDHWMKGIKEATGIDGKELYNPVRIALTGTQTGPDLDKLLPLIEEGSVLGMGIPSVQQRIERFVGV